MNNNIVLLLEDDNETAEIISFLLVELGCKVILSSPETYIHDIYENTPGVVLLDYWIEKTLGSEICIALKNNPATAELPVILTSAVNNIGEIAVACNADDVLAKPFDIEELEAKVLKWINKPSSNILN